MLMRFYLSAVSSRFEFFEFFVPRELSLILLLHHRQLSNLLPERGLVPDQWLLRLHDY